MMMLKNLYFLALLTNVFHKLPFASAFTGSPCKSTGVLKAFSGARTDTIAENSNPTNVIESFIASLNDGLDPANFIDDFDENIQYTDSAFYSSIEGRESLLRHLYLFQGDSALSLSETNKIVVDDMNCSELDGTGVVTACVLYHLETLGGKEIPTSKGITMYSLRENKISELFDVIEPSNPKPGNAGLNLLNAASTVIDFFGDSVENDLPKEKEKQVTRIKGDSVALKYFDAWNRRDMGTAVTCFSEECVYEDLQFSEALKGKQAIQSHLLKVADSLPSTFTFHVDYLSQSRHSDKIGVQWHVENNGEPLPFTRGCSFYTTDEKGLILTGVDIPEPPVIKPGIFKSFTSKISAEPIRLVPVTVWVAYMYIVFFSDGILPGSNALALEQRTWEEVRDLSLNFFLVSPLLNLPFAPTVNPVLEGVFNLLLSWAALFTGFLSDERIKKPNLLPFGPMVLGMQFLTSAFLLPYLALRTSEKSPSEANFELEGVYKEDITGTLQSNVAEWRPLGLSLGCVGLGSIIWASLARPEYGVHFSERYSSFIELLSIDRVGSSFLVDLLIFALFQCWLVDDDLKRRGIAEGEMMDLRSIAKYVPFFGMAYYLTVRPALPSKDKI